VAEIIKPILIGMNNPISQAPEHALYPLPEGCSGNRLWKMLNEVDPRATMWAYKTVFRRTNLVVGPFNTTAARHRAAEMMETQFGGARSVVLLGRQVSAAFGLPGDLPPASQIPYVSAAGMDFYYLPHPSGRNLWYNQEANRRAAGEVLATLFRAYVSRKT
jgi:hypothetical protein